MATAKTLADAFYETLKDVLYAERASARALKKAAKAAKELDLKRAFEDHLAETEAQIERLGEIFDIIGKAPRAKTCEAMQGLTAEMEEDLEEFASSPASDDVLIGCAQAVEHYEMARYGMLKSWSAKLGYDEATPLLQKTLDEEKAADERLTKIAEQLAA
jgi:ferritin-like metal-binding protein YciE